MKKKIIPIVIAIVLIIIIGGVTFGSRILEKYSYSKERADLNAYYGITGSQEVAIVLQDEIVEEKARISDGICYLDMATIHKYLNDRFYVDGGEGLLLYTLPEDIVRNSIGSSVKETAQGSEELGYTAAIWEGDTLYVALDYIKQYTNFSYQLFTDPYRIQLTTEWPSYEVASISKNTQVRVKGGVKSEILTDVQKGDQVSVLEQMETWSKVKTADSVIGYVENKRLTGIRSEQPIPVTDYQEPEYTSLTRDHKINLGWHVVASAGGNDTFNSVTANAGNLNVISPTWFKLCDNEGGYTSFASADYVQKAHDRGLEVWALIENIEYKDSISMYEILSSTTTRQKLIDSLMNDLITYGIDGINVDFEQLSMDCGEHFVEFIRELSVACRKNGKVLSVDNYVPRDFNDYYDRKEQGIVADYVIVMGYDEHYAGSKEAGSVASIDYVEDGIAQTVKEVPAEKVINAIPFYTRIWETTGDGISSQAVDMVTAEQFISNHGITAEWDETTCQNYGEYTSGDSRYQVWLEDADSIKVKLNVMENYGIGGVAEWRLGFEKPEIWDVIGEYLDK
ncbi:glycosyl hydrolase family 18 protein [Suilimivivens sp.]|uniref:glycosyl hydrolase family 18 protein n=1 Tax=Suilimivivens sp. TaxID=2981669 RepID=UPI00307B264C